jgi:cytochrome c-type biogenesis protein CcmH/NrfF
MQRHDVDPISLAFGLLFAIAGLLLLTGDPSRGTVWLGWVGPAVAIGLGALVILAVRPRGAELEDEAAAGDEG